MKVIASNIFDFTTWYKFGFKLIPADLIIDLSDTSQDGDVLLYKTGFFEEEYEVFFLEIPESTTNNRTEAVVVSLHDILSLKSLTGKGGNLLSSKIPDFNISEPIPFAISDKIIEARNRHIAMQGGIRLAASFGVKSSDQTQEYSMAFIQPLLKYLNDLSAEQDSILDNMLFYERSKPYPLTDIGFLFDVGAIARSRFRLTDDDFKNKMKLQEVDPDKYELIEEVLSLSKFLQSKNIDRVWTEFLSEYAVSDWLKKLNSDLQILAKNEDINNILVIAFYLKFRHLIRDANNLDDKKFTDKVSQFLKKVPTEAAIALNLVGMFFGSLKFKELFYKNLPLEISRYKYRISNQSHKQEFEPPKETVQIEIISSDNLAKKEEFDIETQSSDQTEKNNVLGRNSNDLTFDEMFWAVLDSKIPQVSKAQHKIIKECYFKVANAKSDPFTSSHQELMVNMLKKRMRESKAKKPESKLTAEIIEKVQSILFEYFPSNGVLKKAD